ncbi:MAG: hypothetical protein PF450_03170 [Bacteroidales bacterium]|nr:hypothetical protein [Bacteroidales bacterium]
MNFDSSNSAIILFDTQLDNCFPPIKEFVKFLKENNIKTKVYGYLSQKEIPDEMALRANFDFITKKDTSWFGSLKGDVAEKYFESAPDLLFVVSFKENLSIEYLAQLSRARFKIGCYTENENDLDLMINPAKKDCEVGFFIEQVKHYIKLINPSK